MDTPVVSFFASSIEYFIYFEEPFNSYDIDGKNIVYSTKQFNDYDIYYWNGENPVRITNTSYDDKYQLLRDAHISWLDIF